jgi:hypothetical protein
MVFEKVSKSDYDGPSEIVITDAIRLSALKSELNYWKLRHELALKYNSNKDST